MISNLSRKWRRLANRQGLWFLLLVALVVVLVGCQSEDQAADPGGSDSEAKGDGDVLPEGQLFTVGFTDDGHPFKGDPNAPVTIEEFSSYQCPFCARFFAETYPALMSQYVETGQVLYIFRDYPLSGQPQSPKAAEAARCAGEVSGAQAFWDMHDRLFEGQPEWSGRANAEQIFKEYARGLGIGQSSYDDCLDSGRMSGGVESDGREGLTRGVRGTPSFFINGQRLVGAQPVGAFVSVIDAALAGEPASPSAASGGAGADASAAAPPTELLVPTPAVFDFESSSINDGLFALGDPEAPVAVVEFTDFQCPFCQRYAEDTWPALKEQYIDTGRVYYVFKDFPITQLHPQAPKAHEAARCAAALGGNEAYWQMHDRLFESQSEWAENPDHVVLFKHYAGELGFDRSTFDACLDSGDFAGAVQAVIDEGRQLGVRATPTFFVQGYPFSGAQPIEFFDQAISLAENGQLRDAIAEAIARAQAQQQEQQRPAMAPADVPIGDAPVKGDPAAPITIVEYSDYQCPFCSRHFQQTMPELLRNYIETGKVRYVFKDFPLTQIHPQAPKAHEAARCAREVGGDDAYWLMHDRLFEGQEAWSGNTEHVALFQGFAGELGLDRVAFDECLESGRHAPAVQADLEEGVGFGVSGTPAFFVNGLPLEGAQPYQVFEQAIEQLLADN